jgi:hypothetical protein
MSVLNTGVGRMTPKTDIQQFVYNGSLATSYLAVNGISIQFWNMHSGMLGSTNGTTYGTVSNIAFQIARENWASFYVGIAIESPFNVDVNMSIYQMYTVATIPFFPREAKTKLLSVTIPQLYMSFGVSDAVQADGGIVGGSTAAHYCHYRVSPGLACPTIGIEFTSLAAAPTTGRFFVFDICRAS